MKKIRKHIIFSGRVQGVGFRYRSYYIAQALGVTGWVRNTWDDRVEMEVQGTGADIDQMLKKLHEQRFICIDTMDIKEIPVQQESSFYIR